MINGGFLSRGWIIQTAILLTAVLNSYAAERFESFDKDPGWEGHNNRSASPAPRTIKQDFGYSRTSHFGSAPGEMGGLITPAAEPAWDERASERSTASKGRQCERRA